MKAPKSQINSSTKPFQSLEEIVRATGRSWRTVRNRLAEAKCYPLPPGMDRGDVLLLFDDSPEPVYTEAELQRQRDTIDAMLKQELEREVRRGKKS